MATGTMKWFDATRGYGFIVADDKSSDVFFHKQHVPDDIVAKLEPGAPVEYSLATNNRGRVHATHIVLLQKKKKDEVQFKKARTQERELDDEELFEREWGLRRAI